MKPSGLITGHNAVVPTSAVFAQINKYYKVFFLQMVVFCSQNLNPLNKTSHKNKSGCLFFFFSPKNLTQVQPSSLEVLTASAVTVQSSENLGTESPGS